MRSSRALTNAAWLEDPRKYKELSCQHRLRCLKDLRRIKVYSATWQKPMPWRFGLNFPPDWALVTDDFDDLDAAHLQIYSHVHVERRKVLRR